MGSYTSGSPPFRTVLLPLWSVAAAAGFELLLLWKVMVTGRAGVVTVAPPDAVVAPTTRDEEEEADGGASRLEATTGACGSTG